MSEVVIRAIHLRKTFRDYKSNLQKMKHMLVLSGAGEKNNVFSNVSFEIKKGEKVAIILDSGIGKTSLMRLLAGIITPEKGRVEVNGRLTSILDYRCGFDNSLTVQDNYEIACALLGWPRDVTEQRQEEILEAAGLTQMKEQPLRICKAAGANRLGFNIHTYEKPDILIFDEGFSFGSKKLNSKYVKRLKEIVSDPEVTLVMSANSTAIAGKLCTRGIVIHNGKVEFDGDYEEALAYHKENPDPKSDRMKAEAEPEEESNESAAAEGADNGSVII